jgi:hypothetical protein
MFAVDGDCEKNGYRSEDGTMTLKRENGKTPSGNNINHHWVLREDGVYLTKGQYRIDIAERFDLRLINNGEDV